MMTLQQKEKIVDLLKLYECFGIQYMEPLSFSKENIQLNTLLPTSYKKLYEYIDHCNLCELSKRCEKKVGINDPASSIYVIDLNYSFNDSETINHLKALFEMILGFDFNKVYMTNIIKCETNSINFNYNDIASTCEKYIFQEIMLGKPKYIFATISASKYILKNKLIDNNFVGNSYKVNESILFPVFDFDFISKNPSYKDEMERVFKKIRGLIS